ncbi:hypothetical protein ABE354_03805 [Brevibacillus laterosporus]|uniref:hypothetical protein n=1 Tax=Brevibacillus laterosporus TaxID=1465 RepID=UPI003D24175E
MKQLKAFLDKHKIEMLDDLIKCIQIPSISTTGSYEEELETLFRTNQTLPINVKLLIEGEEEIGSTTMPEILQDYSELLIADLIVISDTAMLEVQVPAICYGLIKFIW